MHLGISVANPISSFIGIPIVIYYLLILYEVCMGIAMEARKFNNTKIEKRAPFIFSLNVAQKSIVLVCIFIKEVVILFSPLILTFFIIVHVETMILMKQSQNYLEYINID